MPTIAEAVVAEMEKESARYIWFGELDMWAAAYTNATGKSAHPMDAWQAVRNALSRSTLFRQRDYIRAATWSGREILHPRYFVVPRITGVGPFEVSFDAVRESRWSIKDQVVRDIIDTRDRSRKHRETVSSLMPMREANALLYRLEAAMPAGLPSEDQCEALLGAVVTQEPVT